MKSLIKNTQKFFVEKKENITDWLSAHKLVWAGSFLLAALIFALSANYYAHLHQLQQQVAEKVIRFHVLANSDSAADQELKLAVRDRIGSYLGQVMETEELRAKEELHHRTERESAGLTVEESRQLIQEQLPQIEAIASAEIQSRGYDYPVTASFENCAFPEKTYGGATFPAGQYEALRVVIGAGEGQNWWCVLYPNLCFAGSLYTIEEDGSGDSSHNTGLFAPDNKHVEEQLAGLLTPEEYRLIMETKDFEIRSRFLEVFTQR